MRKMKLDEGSKKGLEFEMPNSFPPSKPVSVSEEELKEQCIQYIESHDNWRGMNWDGKSLAGIVQNCLMLAGSDRRKLKNIVQIADL